MSRDTIVKATLIEGGIGSIDAKMVWESDPDEFGAFVRLDCSIDGRLFISLTDMEEFDGSYSSVEVKPDELQSLVAAIGRMR